MVAGVRGAGEGVPLLLRDRSGKEAWHSSGTQAWLRVCVVLGRGYHSYRGIGLGRRLGILAGRRIGWGEG